jgi:transcriptional regulator with XRE-family HTH domain
MSVSAKLKQAREEKGLSQTELGRLLHKPRSHVAISQMESGQTRIDAVELWEMAEILDKSIEWFYDGAAPKSNRHDPDWKIIEQFKEYARKIAGLN